jgi:hypothetical protein
MGFFDAIFDGLGSIATTVANSPITAALAQTTPLGSAGLAAGLLTGAATGTLPTSRTAASAAAGLAGLPAPTAAALVALAAQHGITAPLSGNRQATIVFKFNSAGQAAISMVESGHPTIMSRDAQKARRYIKTVGKLERKLPRKTRAPSKSKMLTEAIETELIDNVKRLSDGGPHHHGS